MTSCSYQAEESLACSRVLASGNDFDKMFVLLKPGFVRSCRIDRSQWRKQQ